MHKGSTDRRETMEASSVASIGCHLKGSPDWKIHAASPTFPVSEKIKRRSERPLRCSKNDVLKIRRGQNYSPFQVIQRGNEKMRPFLKKKKKRILPFLNALCIPLRAGNTFGSIEVSSEKRLSLQIDIASIVVQNHYSSRIFPYPKKNLFQTLRETRSRIKIFFSNVRETYLPQLVIRRITKSFLFSNMFCSNEIMK